MGDIVKYKASDGAEVTLSPSVVAKYIVTGGQQAPEREVMSFMAKCKARRLNPFAGDAYMTCFNGKASVVVSKDYFVRTATQQPTFDGFKAGVVIVNAQGQMIYREGSIVGATTERLVGGWAEVYDKARKQPSRAEVSLSEYDQQRALWKSKPATMIRKVALVQALREAYPGAYGGIYDTDEMPEPDSPVVPEPEPVYVEAQSVQEPVIEDATPEPPAEVASDPDLYDADVNF